MNNMSDTKTRALKVKKEGGTRFSKEVRGDSHGGKIAFFTGRTVDKETTGQNATNKSIGRYNHKERVKVGEAGSHGYRPRRRE